MPDAEGAITRLCSDGTDVSAHYIVLEDGRIVQTVPEAKRAWHAGSSFWAGEDDINSCSIGIEIINRGHDWGYPDFPLRQIAANAGHDGGVVAGRLLAGMDENLGFNAQTEQYENLFQAGVIDPTKVVRCAIQDAASIAGMIITTEAAIADLDSEAAQ